MRVLVTGGAGYVGSTLVPLLLNAGHEVRVLDSLCHGSQSLFGVWAHPGFAFHRGDVRDSVAVRQALEGIEAVVHLAAIVGDPACARDPDLARAVNLDASLALIAAELGSPGLPLRIRIDLQQLRPDEGSRAASGRELRAGAGFAVRRNQG